MGEYDTGGNSSRNRSTTYLDLGVNSSAPVITYNILTGCLLMPMFVKIV